MDLDNYDALDVSILENPQTLLAPDLVEEYHKLSTCYIKQKQLIDRCMQEIFTLKKDKELKDKILNQELQEITDQHERELSDIKNKHLLEYEELQNRHAELRSVNEKNELENQHLKSELEAKIKQLQGKVETGGTKTFSDNETIVSKKRIDHLTKIESEYADLTEEIYQIKAEKSQLKSRITEIENELENMKERYECSQENLKYKADELEEAQNIIDSMQEKLVGVENELLSYKNGDTDHNKKGNSLFAEVDDQRQQMRDLLSRQKQQYLAMKSKYERSSSEINRLKRENADMLNEVKECVNMFKNAEKFEKSKLNEHIGFLKTENNRLSEKLKQTQLEMDTLAKSHGVDWLSSMLEYCENETKELNSRLMSYGMKKCEAEGLYAQAQERAAKWRFEALKSRCVIINREMLLESNGISFDPKVQNVRQLVDRKFGPNEEPVIDDALYPAVDISTNDIAPVANDSIVNDYTESWSDVREFFSNINDRVPTDKKTLPPSQSLKNLSQIDNTIVMLPDEDLFCEKFPPRPTVNSTVLKSECTKVTKDVELIENKENIKSNSTLKMSPKKTDEKMSSNSYPPILTNKSEINPTNVSQRRARPVNVELFTVTLKGRDS